MELVAIGEILAEMVAIEQGQGFLEPGLFAGPYPSGAPAIFAAQAARTGCRTALVGSVGDDAFGELCLQRLERSGVDMRWIRHIPGRPTGTAFVSYEKDGSRSFVFNLVHSAAGMLEPSQLSPELFRGCRVFHVMGTSLIAPGVVEAVRLGIRLARDAGAEISFDPNIRPELLTSSAIRETLGEILCATNIFLPSQADLEYFYPGVPERQAAALLLERGIRMVALKRGDRGSLYFDSGQCIETAAFPAEVVDPTGAGDCFGATFLSCLIQGLPPRRALLLANAAGAAATERRGPMEGASSMEELERRVAN